MPSAQKTAKLRGIYCICNIMNGSLYIGSTYTNFARRWGEHLRFLKRGTHHSKRLQAAWNFFGESSFCFSILEQCDKGECTQREQYWMDMLHPEYNVAPKAMSPNRGTGWNHTPAAKLKMSMARLGIKLSDETKGKIRAARALQGATFKGRKHTQESLIKMSKSLTGRKWNKSNGDHFMVGRKLDESVRVKMSESAKIGWVKRRASQ